MDLDMLIEAAFAADEICNDGASAGEMMLAIGDLASGDGCIRTCSHQRR